MNNNPIIQFGDGSTSRDYTYIDDIVSGVVRMLFNYDAAVVTTSVCVSWKIYTMMHIHTFHNTND